MEKIWLLALDQVYISQSKRLYKSWPISGEDDSYINLNPAVAFWPSGPWDVHGTYAYQTADFHSLGEGVLAVFSQRFISVSFKLI